MSESTILQPSRQEELMQYMKAAIDVETELLTQERILAQCEADIESRKPVLKLQEEPPKPEMKPAEEKSGTAAICYVSGMIFLFMSIWGFSKDAWAGIFVVLVAVVFFCIGAGQKKSGENVQNENMNTWEYYENKRKDVQKTNQRLRAEYNQAVADCYRSIDSIRESMQPHTEATKALLDKLYSKGVIYPKYCTLPALTSIYEYFLTGRCTELTGPHGAYNLYEDELRKDTVISQLNTVIENLEQIRQNQFMLYQQVKAVQENTAAIASELRQIKGYTVQIAEMSKLTAYYAALNERNTRLTMYYHL